MTRVLDTGDMEERYLRYDPTLEKTLLNSPPSTRSLASFISSHTRLSTVPRYCKSIAWELLPSYVRGYITKSSPVVSSSKGIDALDGLRGLACLTVFNEHFSINYTGLNPNLPMLRWPFVSLVWSGHTMVCVFFVISGYVLSCKPLATRQQGLAGFHKVMASSILRRAIRLYLPPLVAILFAAAFTSFGGFQQSATVLKSKGDYIHLHEKLPHNLGSFFPQMLDGVKDSWGIVDLTIPWDDKNSKATEKLEYDSHLWTIPVEFRNSMLIFLVLVGTSQLRAVYRVACDLILLLYTMITGRGNAFLFLGGMFVAEIDTLRKTQQPRNAGHHLLNTHDVKFEKETSPSLTHNNPGRSHQPRLPNYLSTTIWVTLFVLGLFFLSVIPGDGKLTAGWFVRRNLGAIATTWAVANCASLGPIFNNPVVFHLGKISYALYLVHGNVIKSLGFAILPWTFEVATGRERSGIKEKDLTGSNTFVAWLVGMMCVFPITLWISDVFWRLIDIPSVKFARWVETKMTMDDYDRR